MKSIKFIRENFKLAKKEKLINPHIQSKLIFFLKFFLEKKRCFNMLPALEGLAEFCGLAELGKEIALQKKNWIEVEKEICVLFENYNYPIVKVQQSATILDEKFAEANFGANSQQPSRNEKELPKRKKVEKIEEKIGDGKLKSFNKDQVPKKEVISTKIEEKKVENRQINFHTYKRFLEEKNIDKEKKIKKDILQRAFTNNSLGEGSGFLQAKILNLSKRNYDREKQKPKIPVNDEILASKIPIVPINTRIIENQIFKRKIENSPLSQKESLENEKFRPSSAEIAEEQDIFKHFLEKSINEEQSNFLEDSINLQEDIKQRDSSKQNITSKESRLQIITQFFPNPSSKKTDPDLKKNFNKNHKKKKYLKKKKKRVLKVKRNSRITSTPRFSGVISRKIDQKKIVKRKIKKRKHPKILNIKNLTRFSKISSIRKKQRRIGKNESEELSSVGKMEDFAALWEDDQEKLSIKSDHNCNDKQDRKIFNSDADSFYKTKQQPELLFVQWKKNGVLALKSDDEDF